MLSGANNITRQKQAVNELNVFPVPDGDTGTNMSMTITAAAKTLMNLDEDENATVEKISQTVASALLRGARGNSGVILSLLFRGFAAGCKGKEALDGAGVADALALGVEAAYKAVLKPTEGTILTVARHAARGAAEAAAAGKDAVEVLAEAREWASRTLEQTPEMLPVLKKAGVVDAGGKGFVVILDGMLTYLRTGEIVPETDGAPAFGSDGVVDTVALREEDITFTYCTEFIVHRDPNATRDPIKMRAYLETIGDSVVVVEDADIIKVHVHTDNPGKAIQEGLQYGMLDRLKIDNMRLQYREQEKATRQKQHQKVAPEKRYGIVAVAAGSGLADIFRDLGCDQVVEGGQTMNPSTQDILAAVEVTPAEEVFVLPNNKNIIMAAEQAVPIADRKVHVIRTKTIPQGVSAALAFDASMETEPLIEAMDAARKTVATGQITYAARDSDFDGVKIREGEILALAEGKLEFTEKDPVRAAVRLCRKLVKDTSQFLTVFYGADVTEETAGQLSEALEKQFNGAVEISVIPGGQPVYHFILSVE